MRGSEIPLITSSLPLIRQTVTQHPLNPCTPNQILQQHHVERRFRGILLLTLTGSQLVWQLVFQLVVPIGFGRQRRLGFFLLQGVQAAFRLPGWAERAHECTVRRRRVTL